MVVYLLGNIPADAPGDPGGSRVCAISRLNTGVGDPGARRVAPAHWGLHGFGIIRLAQTSPVDPPHATPDPAGAHAPSRPRRKGLSLQTKILHRRRAVSLLRGELRVLNVADNKGRNGVSIGECSETRYARVSIGPDGAQSRPRKDRVRRDRVQTGSPDAPYR